MKKMAMLLGFIIVASACVAVAGAQTLFREFNAIGKLSFITIPYSLIIAYLLILSIPYGIVLL